MFLLKNTHRSLMSLTDFDTTYILLLYLVFFFSVARYKNILINFIYFGKIIFVLKYFVRKKSYDDYHYYHYLIQFIKLERKIIFNH